MRNRPARSGSVPSPHYPVPPRQPNQRQSRRVADPPMRRCHDRWLASAIVRWASHADWMTTAAWPAIRPAARSRMASGTCSRSTVRSMTGTTEPLARCSVGGTAERARTSVTRSLRYALGRLAAHHPALAAHLEQSIHTGTYCVYTPDPLAPTLRVRQRWSGSARILPDCPEPRGRRPNRRVQVVAPGVMRPLS